MPLVAANISKGSFSQYVGMVPTAVNARRSNKEKAVPVHNPAQTLIDACTKAWTSVLLSTSLTGIYVGVAAPGAATHVAPSPFFLPMAAAGASMLVASMGWTGVHAYSFAHALTGAPALLSMSTGKVYCSPVPGGGPGSGVISIASSPYLSATSPAFYSAMKANITSTGKFTVDDSGATLTPQIQRLMVSLSSVYASIFSSILCFPPFVGGVAPSPMTGITTGTIK